jgi:hypothetical protein
MIAHASSGRGFHHLIQYLLHGRSGQERDRVAWTQQQNLALDDPEHTAALMRATAAQNQRVEEPAYHIVLAFDPSDRPGPALMRQVADRLLAELGLSEHQALIVAHRDRPHQHMHIVVNRVHPETGLAWDRWHDQVVAQRTLRRLERSLGLREVDGRLHQLTGQRAPKQRERRPRREFPRPHDDIGPEQFRRVNRAAQHVFDADLLRHLNRLELEATRSRAADAALDDRFRHTGQRLDTASRKLYSELDAVYARPLAAKERFDEVLYTQGPGVAIRRLRDDPASYVELRPYARPIFLGLREKVDESTARELVPRAVHAASEYASAVRAHRDVLRQMDPGWARTAYDDSVRAETEHAAHSERIERELARLRAVREQLPGDNVLRQRARDAVRQLRPNELTRLKRMMGSTVADLAAVLQHRVVRDIVMGRELSGQA